MSHVCAHCGEMFEEGRLVCPHCGADADLTWSEAPIEADYEGVGYSASDEEAPEPPTEKLAVPERGCAVALLALVALSAAAGTLLL